ncbi:hypothetical protein OQA88_12698 [Cercophora sp. LCS_1]
MDPNEPDAGTIALFALAGLATFFAFNRQEAHQSNILLGLVAISFPPIVVCARFFATHPGVTTHENENMTSPPSDDGMFSNALRSSTLRHAYGLKHPKPAPKPSTSDGKDDAGLEHLDDGNQKLYSFFPRGLDGGVHTVSVTQSVNAPGAKEEEGSPDPQTLSQPRITTKQFNADAPSYVLPGGCVHSTNPVDGERAAPEALPHIVFSDPHMPWERAIPGTGDEGVRERTRWTALLVFSEHEVRLGQKDLNGPEAIFRGTNMAVLAETGRPIKQNANFACNMAYSDVDKIDKKAVLSPIRRHDKTGADPSMAVLFTSSSLFKLLMAKFDNGVVDKSHTKPDLTRYEHLAHARRHVKTAGMAASAQYERGLFSVVLPHRVGPLSDQPTTAIAHLVSLEGWNNMDRAELDQSGIRIVALNPLYAWSYTAMPVNSFNAVPWMGSSEAPGDMAIKAKASSGSNPRALKLTRRLLDGYTLTRYRTPTGETAAAFFRGAFVPNLVQHALTPEWTAMTNCGTDTQILDPDTGLLDITYSAAWSLGKTLALADQNFTMSLSRLRNRVLAWARLHALLPTEASPELGELLTEAIDRSYDNDKIQETMEVQAAKQARRLAGTAFKFGVTISGQPDYPFDELGSPASADWMVVASRVLDRMYLFGVPPHYLIPDLSFLPEESIRFFHVDANWIDCLIDGAFSLANHISQSDDFLRLALKIAINKYLETEMQGFGYRPQIPSYGFLLRSDLGTQFPDMKVEAPFPEHAERRMRASILRQEIISSGILLCLFDRA